MLKINFIQIYKMVNLHQGMKKLKKKQREKMSYLRNIHI